jgi:hypothetical protein
LDLAEVESCRGRSGGGEREERGREDEGAKEGVGRRGSAVDRSTDRQRNSRRAEVAEQDHPFPLPLRLPSQSRHFSSIFQSLPYTNPLSRSLTSYSTRHHLPLSLLTLERSTTCCYRSFLPFLAGFVVPSSPPVPHHNENRLSSSQGVRSRLLEGRKTRLRWKGEGEAVESATKNNEKSGNSVESGRGQSKKLRCSLLCATQRDLPAVVRTSRKRNEGKSAASMGTAHFPPARARS